MDNLTKDQIVNAISHMSVLDIMDLIKLIEQKFNISLSNIQDRVPSTSNNDFSKKDKEKIEKSEFNIVLKSIGKNKIAVIRTIRNLLGLGLKEAKDFVESAPKIIKEKINKEETERLKNILLETGALIEIN